MTASLPHAHGVLAAAINAGFRESGLQSLKILESPDALPMVAVRTAGLGVSSVVGLVMEDGGECVHRAIVDDAYLEMLLALANDQFSLNRQRMSRFQQALSHSDDHKAKHWEEPGARAERKRREGLEASANLRKNQESNPADCTDVQKDNLNMLEDIFEA